MRVFVLKEQIAVQYTNRTAINPLHPATIGQTAMHISALHRMWSRLL